MDIGKFGKIHTSQTSQFSVSKSKAKVIKFLSFHSKFQSNGIYSVAKVLIHTLQIHEFVLAHCKAKYFYGVHTNFCTINEAEFLRLTMTINTYCDYTVRFSYSDSIG